MPNDKDQPTPSFSEIRQKLQAGEDFDLANRLQEREYDMYYSHNRNVNGTIVSDRKKTREEQQTEDEQARELRRLGHYQREMTDEEIARQLQDEMDRQDAAERMSKQDQLLMDEELARILQQSDYSNPQPSQPPVTQDLISFGNDDNRVRSTITVTETQYNNMANEFLESPAAPEPPVIIELSPTNPFLHDVQQMYSQNRQ